MTKPRCFTLHPELPGKGNRIRLNEPSSFFGSHFGSERVLFDGIACVGYLLLDVEGDLIAQPSLLARIPTYRVFGASRSIGDNAIMVGCNAKRAHRLGTPQTAEPCVMEEPFCSSGVPALLSCCM
jgi:hypothetical protein